MPEPHQENFQPQPNACRTLCASPGSVLPLLSRFAKESCASFDDIVARFFGSALSGEFDHIDQDDPEDKCNCELTILFKFSFPGPIGKPHDWWGQGHRIQPVNREDFLGWLSDLGVLPRPIGAYRKLFNEPEAPDTTETYKISADIISQCVEGNHLTRFLRALRIDKHNFARWATESFKHSPPMLEAIGADPVHSRQHHIRTLTRHAAARQTAMQAGLTMSFVHGLSTLIPHDAPTKNINAIRSLIDQERTRGKAHFHQGAIAKYLHATKFPTKSMGTLRRWIRTAMSATHTSRNSN